MQVEQFYNPAVLVLAFYLIVGGAILRHILKCFVAYLVDHSQEWKAKGIELAEYYVKWILFLLLALIILVDFLWTQAAGQIAGIVIFFLFDVQLDPFFLQIIVTGVACVILYFAMKRALQSIKERGTGIMDHPLILPFRVDKTIGNHLEARRQRATPTLSAKEQKALLADLVDDDSRGLFSLVNLNLPKKLHRRKNKKP